MRRRLAITFALGLAALFMPGFRTDASADVATMDEFNLTLNGPTVFNDNFSAGQNLVGGGGSVLPSGQNFSDGSAGLYLVLGTATETGSKAILDTAQGDHVIQTPPFFPSASLNAVTLLTGPPGLPFSLNQGDTFTTSGLFDMSVPATPGGFYQINLSDRVQSNNGLGDVISVLVVNCAPNVDETCGSRNGAFIQMINADALNNMTDLIASVPLDTSNQQILLELSHDAGGDVVGSYAYVNNGAEGALTPIGTYGGLFNELDYTQAGFVQLAPIPEPSSLALLASSVFGLAWLRRRRAASPKIETAGMAGYCNKITTDA